MLRVQSYNENPENAAEESKQSDNSVTLINGVKVLLRLLQESNGHFEIYSKRYRFVENDLL